MTVTRRELQVAELIAWGASDKEVAMELDLSFETVKTHRKNILKKIDGHNSTDLTRWFFQNKCRISFGMNPRQIRHLAVGLLFLVFIGEYSNHDMIRPVRTTRVSARRSGRRRDESDSTYYMEAA